MRSFYDPNILCVTHVDNGDMEGTDLLALDVVYQLAAKRVGHLAFHFSWLALSVAFARGRALSSQKASATPRP